MLGSGTKLIGRIRLFSSVRYCILPGAVWCGVVHTFSHTRFKTADIVKFKQISLFSLSERSLKWLIYSNKRLTIQFGQLAGKYGV